MAGQSIRSLSNEDDEGGLPRAVWNDDELKRGCAEGAFTWLKKDGRVERFA